MTTHQFLSNPSEMPSILKSCKAYTQSCLVKTHKTMDEKEIYRQARNLTSYKLILNRLRYEADILLGRIDHVSEYVSTQSTSVAIVKENIPVPQVYQIIRDVWKIDDPRMIIRIIGKSKSNKHGDSLPETLKEILGVGLVKVAKSANAIITTDGFDRNLSKEIADSINRYRASGSNSKPIPIIGFSSFSCFHSQKAQKQLREAIKNQMRYIGMPEKSSAFKLMHSGKMDKHLSTINPNHNFVFLVEPETKRPPNDKFKLSYWHDSKNLWLDTEKFIKNYRMKINKFKNYDTVPRKHPIPNVMVCCAGGNSMIESILEFLNERVPIILVNGIGGATDFLIQIYNYYQAHKNDDNFNEYDVFGYINDQLNTPNENGEYEMRNNKYVKKHITQKSNGKYFFNNFVYLDLTKVIIEGFDNLVVYDYELYAKEVESGKRESFPDFNHTVLNSVLKRTENLRG